MKSADDFMYAAAVQAAYEAVTKERLDEIDPDWRRMTFQQAEQFYKADLARIADDACDFDDGLTDDDAR